MVTEQKKTLQILQIALQMEIDGKEFYLKASQGSGNELGRELLRSLASAEDLHRQKFLEIYEAIRHQESWPVVRLSSDGGKSLKTVFGRALATKGSQLKVLPTELDAVTKAMAMEAKTYDFYRGQESKTKGDIEKGFYQSLAAEEKEHQLALLDYYEYLKDPVGWFIKEEHPSLDGG